MNYPEVYPPGWRAGLWLFQSLFVIFVRQYYSSNAASLHVIIVCCKSQIRAGF